MEATLIWRRYTLLPAERKRSPDMAQKHLALVSNPVGWQNPYVGSFNGHLRRELLELESFKTLFEAQLLLEDRRLEYKHYRPH